MTKHTAKALSAESGAPSERTETQDNLWREIAEEGYDRTYTQEERDRMFGTSFEERYKKLTGEDLPATAKQETQGDLWKEIAEEGTTAWTEHGRRSRRDGRSARRKALQRRRRRSSRTGRHWTN